jgi:Probable zinc-ribbon domain
MPEKDSCNEPQTVSASKSSNSKKTIEHKILNSTEMQTSTKKLDASGSENTAILSHEDLALNSNSDVTENRLKEEHAEAGVNKQEPMKENDAPLTVQQVILDVNERSTKDKVQKREEITSISSEDLYSAQNIRGLECEKLVRHVPKGAAAYKKPPKSSHSYEVLQADILSKVDKLRKELVELFGKAPEEIDLSHLIHAKRESSRYRRIRITPQENMAKPHQHHYHFQSTQAQKHGKRHQFVPKKHCLPILVGAPFVICSNCFELIQLPADFNVSTKRLRKLQCGKCSTVLQYSYQPHPYHSRDTTPLTPSESEMGTTPYTESYPRGHRVSISEEYGMSFGISNSTDPEPGPPLHVSRNSSYSTRDGRSGRQTVGSRLHQIMGYDSASEILFRQYSERSERIDEVSERERKGKGIVDEHFETGSSQGRLKRYGLDLPKRSGIHELFKKGIIKLKPSVN